MPYRKIDISAAQEAYKSGTAAKAKKWMDNFLATTGIADAAKSDEAQRRWVAKITDAGIQRKRQKKLSGLSDEDFKAPVRAGGTGLYSSATSAKAPKWGRNFAPFAVIIDETVPKLPPKGVDVDANIDNRVKPIARALHEAATK